MNYKGEKKKEEEVTEKIEGKVCRGKKGREGYGRR